MRKIEAIIIGVFLGAVPPLFCLLAIFIFWFFTGLFTDESVPYFAVAALGAGVIIDIVFLKRWVRRAYQLNNKVLAAIYIFYSVGVLGFCMGVPILNPVLGTVAGVYIARKMQLIGASEEEKEQQFKKTAFFCAAVMVPMCCLITLWAIAGEMIGSRFETPIFSFTFTVPVFFGVVFTGGSALVLLKYWLTSKSAKVAFKVFRFFAAHRV